MPSIVLNCPNCRQPYQMSPEQITKYSGRTITCRKCKQPFAFDAAMDAAAQAAGQADPVDEASPVTTPAADEGPGPNDARPNYAVPAAAAIAQPPPPPRRPIAVAPQPAPSYPPQPAQPASPPPPPPAGSGSAPPAFAPPAVPAGYSPATQPGGIGDLFSFQRMALPAMLPLVFWAGVVYCLYNGLRLLLGFVVVTGYRGVGSSFSAMRTVPATRISFDGLGDRLFSVPGLYTVLDALFWIILGPLFWRGFCELILAASRLLPNASKRE